MFRPIKKYASKRQALAASACVIVLAAGFGALPALGGRGSAPTVPAAQALRLAAQCGARWTYIPAIVPAGYRFASWQVFGHNVWCDAGFAVRFRHGTARLTWEANGPQTFQLRCTDTYTPIARVKGLPVFHQVHGELEKVWACVSRSVRIVVFQHADARRASVRDMVRMVASAHIASSDRAPAGSYRLPSNSEITRMTSRFGTPLFVPREVPPGFVFSHWAYRRRDPNLDGRASLSLRFGRSGAILDWGVYSGIDTSGFACPTKTNRRFPRDKPFVIEEGIPVYLVVGIHGGSVWRCIRSGAFGNRKPLEIELWYSIQLDSPRMRRTLAALVASARVIS